MTVSVAELERLIEALERIAESYPWEKYRPDETISDEEWHSGYRKPTNRRIARETLAALSFEEQA